MPQVTAMGDWKAEEVGGAVGRPHKDITFSYQQLTAKLFYGMSDIFFKVFL